MKSLRSTTSLDDKAASVQGAITAVHDVSEELLHKSLNEVKDLNKVQLATIRQLREDILGKLNTFAQTHDSFETNTYFRAFMESPG